MGRKPNKLTDRQKKFCSEYIIDWNAARAARAAGYSAKTADIIGYQTLQKPYISEYIEQIQEDLAKQAGISALRNINELKKIAFANVSSFNKGWSTLEEWEQIPEADKAAIAEISFEESEDKNGNTTTKVKYKLHDKQKAIDSLNRMLGWTEPDKQNSGVIILNGDAVFSVEKPKVKE